MVEDIELVMMEINIYNITHQKIAIIKMNIIKYQVGRMEQSVMRFMTDIEKYKNYMDDCLRKTNRCVNINEKNCFILSNNVVIHIDMIKGMRALVVEYADNIDEAKINRFEDGDLFYIDEYDEGNMLKSILNEINSCF